MRRGVAALMALLFLGSGESQARQEPLPGWFDLQVPGGVATLEALGISVDERALTVPILARALHDRDVRLGLTPVRVASLLGTALQQPPAGDAVAVPVPLDAKAWWQLMPPPRSGDLFARLVTDRNALLLAAGLMSTDDSIRTFLARDRDLLKWIYQHGAGAFVVVARRLEIAGNSIRTPGGEQGAAVWRALVGEPVTRPAQFLRLLLSKDGGRLAWYFDTIAGLDPQHLAAAWTLPGPDAGDALYSVFRESDPQWRLQEHPFRRGLADAWTVATQVDVDGKHAASPLPQPMWNAIFSESRLSEEQAARILREHGGGVSLPWLAREVVMAPVRERRHRFEMFHLAQRVFARAPVEARASVAVAVHGLRDFRALAFALERMEIPTASTWSAVMTAARHVARNSADRRDSLVAFQSVLALIERIRHARTIDVEGCDRLLRSLSEAVRTDDRVTRSLSKWIVDGLTTALPPLVRPDAFTEETAYESTILQALAGPPASAERQTPTLEWEGLIYRVDIVAAEHDRLRAMRAQLASPGLDRAIAGGRPRELADALMALAYATALGDPEGPASLSPDIVARHNFGLTGTSLVREELPWAPPEERQGFGPWHVQGAVLGLDLALSRLAMRRIADEQMPSAPTLTLNDLSTLTRSAVAMVPAELIEDERNELASAIARGRARVEAAGTDLTALDTLAAEARMSDTTRRLIPWIKMRQPGTLPALFSLGELLWLGKPRLTPPRIDRWGTVADALGGRRVTSMPQPAPWEDYAGRSEAGQVTTQVPDLTLRLVEETARLKLPAVLVPALLGFALQDYWHEVQARFADDWPQLTRQAAALPASRIEDYIAALTGNGPLRAQ